MEPIEWPVEAFKYIKEYNTIRLLKETDLKYYKFKSEESLIHHLRKKFFDGSYLQPPCR